MKESDSVHDDVVNLVYTYFIFLTIFYSDSVSEIVQLFNIISNDQLV